MMGRERSGRQQGGMGEGGGLGTEGRGRCGAAGPSSSVGARRLWVGGCPVRGCSSCGGGASSSMGGASSSVGDPSHPCVCGGSRPWVGPLLCPWALLVVGAGWSFCSWATSFVGARSLSVGAASLFVGPGLSIVGGGARSCGRVVRGRWFVVRGRGGDVSCAGWGDASCAGWSPLARWDGMAGLLTKQQRRTTTSSSFVVWLPCRSRRRGT